MQYILSKNKQSFVQNKTKQSQLNSLNFGSRIKKPITKLKDDDILEGKMMCFFKKKF